MKQKNIILAVLIIVSIHLNAQESTLYKLIQDFGPAKDSKGFDFLSKGEVFEFEKEAKLMAPEDATVLAIIESGLEKDYGDFIPENLLILQLGKSRILCLFNFILNDLKIGDRCPPW